MLRQLAEQRRKFGAPRLHVLLRRDGFLINHKRTERLYREEGLFIGDFEYARPVSDPNRSPYCSQDWPVHPL
ncbi:MAG: IS3 family transposase [Syntrophotalea sp.]|uniref:IS3 family transposase n=1 Tax=Syntrophotalea sp. TaxID=2812029 RepID=UPI003D0C63E1